MDNVSSLILRLALGFIALGSISGQAQTYIYTYTGNDFTSVTGPYTSSDFITGSVAFSAPLGDNYDGSPPATMLYFNFSDGDNYGGVRQIFSGLPNSYVGDSVFATDSSGAIVAWNFEVVGFVPLNTETSFTYVTVDQPGNVEDLSSIDTAFGNIGAGSASDPGTWVETIVPEPSVGLLFVSSAALLFASGRFKPLPPHPHSGSEG